jgi:hypothetical protein
VETLVKAGLAIASYFGYKPKNNNQESSEKSEKTTEEGEEKGSLAA